MPGHPNIDQKRPPFEPIVVSGLDQTTLKTIAMEMRIIQVLSERQVRKVVVDYIPGFAEQCRVRAPDGEDETPLQSVLVEPIPITFTIEDAMFGGDVFVVLSADGMTLCRPIPWDGYENFGRYVLGKMT